MKSLFRLTLFEKLVPAFSKPSMTLKIVLKADHDTYSYTEEYQPEMESRNRNSDAAFGTILELVSLKKGRKNFIYIFIFIKTALKFQNSQCIYIKYGFYYKVLKKYTYQSKKSFKKYFSWSTEFASKTKTRTLFSNMRKF